MPMLADSLDDEGNVDPETYKRERPASEEVQRRPVRYVLTIAGITDAPVNPRLLTQDEQAERIAECKRLVHKVAALKQYTISSEHAKALVDELAALPYSVRQLQESARKVSQANGYDRPLAWERWSEAFAEQTVSGRFHAARVAEAYHDGIAKGLETSGGESEPDDIARVRAEAIEQMRSVQEAHAKLQADYDALVTQYNVALARIQQLEREVDDEGTGVDDVTQSGSESVEGEREHRGGETDHVEPVGRTRRSVRRGDASRE